MSSQLYLDVFVPYKPIAGLMARMGQGDATRPATCVLLVSGEHDAVASDADPAATAATAAAIAPEMPGQASPGQIQFWVAMFPGQIPGHPAVLAGESTVTDLEGHELRVTGASQSDTDPCTVVYISGPDAVIPGDTAYDGNQSRTGSRSAQQLADAMIAVPSDPGKPLHAADSRKGRLRADTKSIVMSTLTTRQAARVHATGVQASKKVSQMASVRQLTSGGYLLQVSETELALIKTALAQTGRVSRFGMEVLDEANHDKHGRRAENTRLRREIDALAIREASIRSLHETMAETERDDQVA
jgi:hypothetical protein